MYSRFYAYHALLLTDVPNLRDLCKKINIRSPLLFEEPMSRHTSFKIGGPADVFARPQDENECRELLAFCKTYGILYFLLGAGSNILVSDYGIEGMVIDLGGLSGIEVSGESVTAQCGAPVSDACDAALAHSLSGMEFIYSMPGSIGGAIWMNARCYGVSVSDVLSSVEYMGDDLCIRDMRISPDMFAYKRSPFQTMNCVILKGTFILKHGNEESIRAEMEARKTDREKKGHFLAPCAGSIFKNNREFGRSTGEILDSLGAKGLSIGNARVSPLHANIIVNNGKAKAEDVYELMTSMEETAYKSLGIRLEREVILIGRWKNTR